MPNTKLNEADSPGSPTEMTRPPPNADLSKVAAAAAVVGTIAVSAVGTWPERATAILTAAGVLVTGGLGLVATVDHFRMTRTKKWEDFNKTSLSQQLAESLENQTRMRESLHAIRGDAQQAANENHSLREQLAEIGRRLYETDVALNNTSKELREALRLLDESKADREAIRLELARARDQAQATEGRLTKLENGHATK